MSLVSKAFLATALTVGALATSTLAQCPNPDLLDCGPCCTIAQPNMPKFPAFQQTSLDICWKDCNVDNVINLNAQWTAPLQGIGFTGVANCGVYNSKLRLRNAAGVIAWSGDLRMHYSRTWLETGANTNFQVWRFLVNGDLVPTTAAGGMPCPVPPCAPPHNN